MRPPTEMSVATCQAGESGRLETRRYSCAVITKRAIDFAYLDLPETADLLRGHILLGGPRHPNMGSGVVGRGPRLSHVGPPSGPLGAVTPIISECTRSEADLPASGSTFDVKKVFRRAAGRGTPSPNHPKPPSLVDKQHRAPRERAKQFGSLPPKDAITEIAQPRHQAWLGLTQNPVPLDPDAAISVQPASTPLVLLDCELRELCAV